VGLDAFTTWDEYDYVHLLTHGASVCEKLGPDGREVCMSSLLAPWTEEYVRERAALADERGDTDLARLIDLMGVETASVALDGDRDEDELPELRSGSFWVDAAPEDIPDVQRGGTTRRDPSPDGRTRTLAGRFIMLSPRFFNGIYEEGVSDAIVILSACSSGHTGALAGAIRGRNSVVIGWSETMSLGAASAAGTLLAKTLVEVDEQAEDDSGLTVRQSVERIRTWLDDVRANRPGREACVDAVDREMVARCSITRYGQWLTVVNEAPADPVTGANLVLVGDSTMRAREVVYLVDERGAELEDSAVIHLTSDDEGRPGAQLRFRVDGLGLEDDPLAVELKLGHAGREIDVDKALEEEVGPGVWESEYVLPLGGGVQPGDRITLEATSALPDGGDSRWEYRDLLLATCSWQATVAGATVGGGPIDAYWGTARTDDGVWPPLDIDAMVQEGDPQPEGPWLVLSLTNQGTTPRYRDMESWREIKLAIPGIRQGDTGSFSRVWGSLAVGTESYEGNAEYLRHDVIGLPEGTGMGRLLTTDVNLTRYDADRVEGSFDARFLDSSRIPFGEGTPPGMGIHTFPDAEMRVSGEFSILLDQSCRTRSGLR